MFFVPFVFHVVAVLCIGTCKIRNTSQRSLSSSNLQSEMAPVVPLCVCVKAVPVFANHLLDSVASTVQPLHVRIYYVRVMY